MKIKNILAISLAFIVLCTIGTVCAAEIFNPEGFTINKDLIINNGTGDYQGIKCEITQVVMENGTDNITVTNFIPSKPVDISPSGNTVMKNISHAQGMFEQKADGRCVFLYLANETLVEIDAPNEKLIEEVIGK